MNFWGSGHSGRPKVWPSPPGEGALAFRLHLHEADWKRQVWSPTIEPWRRVRKGRYPWPRSGRRSRWMYSLRSWTPKTSRVHVSTSTQRVSLQRPETPPRAPRFCLAIWFGPLCGRGLSLAPLAARLPGVYPVSSLLDSNDLIPHFSSIRGSILFLFLNKKWYCKWGDVRHLYFGRIFFRGVLKYSS